MSKKKLLIVEDNRDISRMLAEFLVEHGYDVECAYEGRQASGFIKNNEYDIILMDLMLPYKSGDSLIKELRSAGTLPSYVCRQSRVWTQGLRCLEWVRMIIFSSPLI